MGWIFTTIILGIIWLVLWIAIGIVLRASGEADHNDRNRYVAQIGIGRLISSSIIGIIIVLVTLVVSIKTVEAGHVGLVYQFGDIIGQRDAGVSIIWPWQSFKSADTRVLRVREHTTCSNGVEECMDSFSKETQDVFIVATLNVSVNPDDIQGLYRTVGPNYLDNIVRPRVAQLVKEETVKYESVDIAPNRETIRVAVRERLERDLAQYSITVHDFLLENIDFRPEFKNSIEQKQLASQEALRQQELVANSKALADQKIEEARGEAERLRVTAQGQSDRLRIEAEGQAQANRLVSESLTPSLIQLKLIEQLAPDLKVLGLPESVLNLLNLNELIAQ